MCKHCWDDDRAVHHKDWIRGYEDVDGFDKEVNYRPKKKQKGFVKYPGCPDNNKGPHIYVWTTELNKRTFFSDYFGFEKYEKKVCAGCGHVDKSRTTEEYNRRNENAKRKRVAEGKRVWSYFSYEDYDETYRAKREAYLKRHGWTDYTYSAWWSI